MKVLFMGTPDFAVSTLKALAENHDIVAIVTQPDRPKGRGNKLTAPPVKDFALEHGITFFQPVRIKSMESIETLKKYDADVFVVVAYGQLLSEEILNMPKYGCINVHASLLPKYRGAAPMEWALINGETITGVTIMRMNKGLDTGPILMQKSFDILKGDDIKTVYDKMARVGSEAIKETLECLKNESIMVKEQDDSLASYAPLLTTETGRIDWRKSPDDIVNLVRGLCGLRLAYTLYKGGVLKILKAEAISGYDDDSADCGQIIDIISDRGLVIKAKGGGVLVTEIQAQGKKAMSVSDYLRGNKIMLFEMLE